MARVISLGLWIYSGIDALESFYYIYFNKYYNSDYF